MQTQPVHPKGNQSWIVVGWTDAKAETPVPWPPHEKCWLIVKDSDAGGIGGRRRRGRQRMRWLDDITTRWTWGLVNSGSCWWTGRPGMLQFMGLQRVRHDWATELSWTELYVLNSFSFQAPITLMKVLFIMFHMSFRLFFCAFFLFVFLMKYKS